MGNALLRSPQIDSFYYIIPPIPGPPAGIAGVSSLMFATTDSVVRSVLATEHAFCSALLVTLTGSRIPASTISTYSSFAASKPIPALDSLTLFTITLPSRPAFATMICSGASSAFSTILAPVFSSPSSVSTSSATFLEAWM